MVALNPMQFPQDSRGLIMGEHARQIFKAANIRSWPVDEGPDTGYHSMDYSGTSDIQPHETLHTRQSHLHAPTLAKYMNYDEPETDPESEGDGRGYHPEIVRDRHDNQWISEGHHRIVASRLRGDLSREAWVGHNFGRQ